jgi:hypothetical protein
MRKLILTTLFAALMVTTITSCVYRSSKCVKAHKNIKKLHLQNW